MKIEQIFTSQRSRRFELKKIGCDTAAVYKQFVCRKMSLKSSLWDASFVNQKTDWRVWAGPAAGHREGLLLQTENTRHSITNNATT